MDTAQNPLGIKAIDHLEFTVDKLDCPIQKLFYTLGFSKTHERKNVELFTQGQIRFLLNASPQGAHREYLTQHGEGVSKISFLVENAHHALETAIQRGAESVSDICTVESEHGIYRTALIKGVGDILNEFVERPSSPFRSNMAALAQDSNAHPLPSRLSRIDHLTNNVPKGELEHWVDFYQRIYGFVETRYFDIKGQKTGLQSKVMQLANGQVIIPINEPEQSQGKSQIQEFLNEHRGAGVQHIALTSADIISSVEELRDRQISFLDVPDTYYEQLPQRPFILSEDIPLLNRLRILADGDKDGYLLQIFTKTLVGPLFFEFIQRKNHWGFGEGNFQALFDAIERDQVKRGYLS